jgi:hypothetical protein
MNWMAVVGIALIVLGVAGRCLAFMLERKERDRWE